MRTTIYNLWVLPIICTALILGGCNFWPGEPDASRSEIPEGTPDEVKADIKRLFSWNKNIRIDATRSLGQKGKMAEPAIPFLVAMLNDNAMFEGDKFPYTTIGEQAGLVLRIGVGPR